MDAIVDKPEWAQSKREKINAERVAAGLKPKRRILPWIVLAILVVGAVAFFVLRPAPVEIAAPEAAPVVKQVRAAEMAVIQPVTLQRKVRVTGTFAPGQQSELSAQTSGRVLSVAVRPGDAVTQGDLIVQIDTESLDIQLSQQRATADATRAQLVSSRQQLDRTEELAKGGLTTTSALEQARSSTAALEANLAALENGVRAAELALANASLRAPISGIVSARSVEPGQTVAQGTPLLTIVNLEQVEYQASASVASSALIAPGQHVAVTVSGLDGREFTGTVTRVNPVAVAGTRTVPVYVMLDNPDLALRGGMFATGQIVVSEKPDAIAVPAVAIREDADGFHVLKLVGSELVRQPVERGAEWERGSMVEVTGLSAGDRVVTAPLAQLAPGEAVSVIEG